MEIRFRAKDGREKDIVASGSGSMIGKKCVITAAHNLFIRDDTEEDKEHRQTHEYTPYLVDFYPGKDGSENSERWHSMAIGTEVSRSWVTARNESTAAEEDVGMIVLEKSLGKETGWYEARNLRKDILQETTITVAGYPSELPKKKTRMSRRSNV